MKLEEKRKQDKNNKKIFESKKNDCDIVINKLSNLLKKYESFIDEKFQVRIKTIKNINTTVQNQSELSELWEKYKAEKAEAKTKYIEKSNQIYCLLKKEIEKTITELIEKFKIEPSKEKDNELEIINYNDEIKSEIDNLTTKKNGLKTNLEALNGKFNELNKKMNLNEEEFIDDLKWNIKVLNQFELYLESYNENFSLQQIQAKEKEIFNPKNNNFLTEATSLQNSVKVFLKQCEENKKYLPVLTSTNQKIKDLIANITHFEEWNTKITLEIEKKIQAKEKAIQQQKEAETNWKKIEEINNLFTQTQITSKIDYFDEKISNIEEKDLTKIVNILLELNQLENNDVSDFFDKLTEIKNESFQLNKQSKILVEEVSNLQKEVEEVVKKSDKMEIERILKVVTSEQEKINELYEKIQKEINSKELKFLNNKDKSLPTLEAIENEIAKLKMFKNDLKDSTSIKNLEKLKLYFENLIEEKNNLNKFLEITTKYHFESKNNQDKIIAIAERIDEIIKLIEDQKLDVSIKNIDGIINTLKNEKDSQLNLTVTQIEEIFNSLSTTTIKNQLKQCNILNTKIIDATKNSEFINDISIFSKLYEEFIQLKSTLNVEELTSKIKSLSKKNKKIAENKNTRVQYNTITGHLQKLTSNLEVIKKSLDDLNLQIEQTNLKLSKEKAATAEEEEIEDFKKTVLHQLESELTILFNKVYNTENIEKNYKDILIDFNTELLTKARSLNNLKKDERIKEIKKVLEDLITKRQEEYQEKSNNLLTNFWNQGQKLSNTLEVPKNKKLFQETFILVHNQVKNKVAANLNKEISLDITLSNQPITKHNKKNTNYKLLVVEKKDNKTNLEETKSKIEETFIKALDTPTTGILEMKLNQIWNSLMQQVNNDNTTEPPNYDSVVTNQTPWQSINNQNLPPQRTINKLYPSLPSLK